jgi:hypothetical protein
MFEDIHNYDGKLNNYEPIKNWTKSEKKQIFEELIKMIPIANIVAINGVNLILKDMMQFEGNNPNFDNINNMDASDLLADLIQKIKDGNDVLSILIEQLEDMVLTGVCPQGRAIRFYQIFITLSF